MKKIVSLISVIILVISFSSCTKKLSLDSTLDSIWDVQTVQETVSESLGQYTKHEMWTHGGFQDYTDYGIYYYSSVKLEDNQYFKRITDSDIETINGFIDNFETWVDTFKENNPDDELVLNYNFERSIIDGSDYVYINPKDSDIEYANYDLFIFDYQTNTLYYFHNNI